MKLEEYSIKALEFLNGPRSLDHTMTGIVTEIGELLQLFRKLDFNGCNLDNHNVQLEIGDICWYANLIDAVPSESDVRNEYHALSREGLYQRHNILNELRLTLSSFWEKDMPDPKEEKFREKLCRNLIRAVTTRIIVGTGNAFCMSDIFQKNINKLSSRRNPA